MFFFILICRNLFSFSLRKISSEAGLKSLKINDRSLEDLTQIISVSDRLVDNIVCFLNIFWK